MKTFPSKKHLHQDQLKQLEYKAGYKLEKLLEHFGLLNDMRKAKRFFVGACPVHGGNKKNAFNIFHEGYQYIGNWRCFTHNCHKHFKPTILGFVRGILSHTKYGWRDDSDDEYPFHKAVNFLTEFCGEKDFGNLTVDLDAFEKRRFSNQMDYIYNIKVPQITYKIPREIIRQSIEIPSLYYISRGYSKEILDRYDVGLCTTPNKEMTMRTTIPIFDEDYQYIVGCTGRSIFEICPICKSYHNPTQSCPSESDKWKFSKWRHNRGFKGEFYLYNYWFAKEHIAKTGIAILVEGPGDVWRLEEAGIHNSLGLFGAHLTNGQRIILDKSGALALVVLTDPDKAGILAAQDITKECQNSYALHFPKINNEDIGDTKVEIIQTKLVPILKKIQQELGL